MSGPVRRATAAAVDGDDKAFWISFADLMTALMVMFLMVMAVALLSITRATQRSSADAEHELPAAAQQPASAGQPSAEQTPDRPQPHSSTPDDVLQALQRQLQAAAAATPGVHFDERRYVIDFGERARFATGSHQLDMNTARLLRQFVPQLLAITESEQGRRWIHRVVVEGFADPRGDYLFNLNLSLQRAQRVMCVLLDTADAGTALEPAQRDQVRSIFSVGGFSFNDQRGSLDASRRIEIRIEFGQRPATSALVPEAGICRLPTHVAAG
jgi:outer membrane protein OmpA-like peptidoglycan-associated protein